MPELSDIGLKRSLPGSKPKPNWPLSLDPRDSPCLSMSFVWSEVPVRLKIAPVACATLALARTRWSSAAGTVAVPLAASLTTSLPEMTALVFE